MQMNKEKFLKTELGIGLRECVTAWNKWIDEGDRSAASWCGAQWEVYKTGIEYHMTRTDEYFGVVTEDERDWLFKVERKQKHATCRERISNHGTVKCSTV